MSRRTFLESVRQEARERGEYDSGSSVVDPGDAARAAAAARPSLHDGLRDMSDTLGHYSVAIDTGARGTPLSLSSNLPTTEPPNGAVGSEYGEASRACEREALQQNGHAAGFSDSSGAPRTFSPPPHAPLEPPHNHTQPEEYKYLQAGQGNRGDTHSSSGGSSSRHHAEQCNRGSEDDFRYRHSHPCPSLDAGLNFGHDNALLSGNSSFATHPAVSAARRHSASHCARRPRRSAGNAADPLEHAESSTSGLRRFSQRRHSSTQARRSLASTSPSPAHRAAALQDRRGSIARMEASLVALQVELAAEKRSNIEAEHHITTLNREVKRLQQENERMSRELAAAATAAAASPDSVEPGAGTYPAGAATSSSISQGNVDTVVAARRIEVLEARLCELSRNMETKQHELDVKDERIRLLEHKLADQLLLYSGPASMGMMPPGASQTLQPGAVAGHDVATVPLQPQGQRLPSRTRPKGSHGTSEAGGHVSPSRLHWQVQAPDTTPAGPKISAIRSAKAQRVYISQSRSSDSAGSRPGSPVRSRSAYKHLSRSDSAGAYEEGILIGAKPKLSSSLACASKTDATVNRSLSITKSHRQSAPRRPSLRGDPGWPSTRKGSVDFAKSHETSPSRRSSGRFAGARPASDTHSTRRRRDTLDSDALGHSTAGASSGRKASGAKQLRHLDRSESTSCSRRPSLQRRTSTSVLRSVTTTACEDALRASPRRSSVASPPYRSFRDRGAGGHPMRLDIGASVGRDPSSSSNTGSTYARAQSIFTSHGSTARRGSATRSVAQQSVRSATSTRSRPQITYSADSESAMVKGTTTTVVFRSSKNAFAGTHSYGGSSYARDGAPLLPTRLDTSRATMETDADLP
ncbi:hypothetical protein LSCM1_05601 [Leishmania martiniquensis]|uniref:Uncharacterized protein n=1 Tax=Leishmania martiniquensis TaxID=1580590 RepID=A0A836H8M0_9TRYP|nr:hypothetical protein LSCM1_05601 [Leishmania martiniquensis]